MICAVLAGGDSRTFGRKKLFWRVFDKTLLEYCVERIEMSKKVEEIVIVSKEEYKDYFESKGLRVLVDDLLIGPIGGIYKALTTFENALVVAGDMPLIVPELLDFMIDKFNTRKPKALVPIWPNRFLEPLHAIYSKEIIGSLENAIKNRVYSLQNILRKEKGVEFLRIENLPKEWQESFFNVNTWEDLAEFVKRLKNKKD